MKNIQTYEEFLNEAIEIVSMTDAGFSNRNRTKYVNKFSDIESILTDPETWTDDIRFKDKLGNVYFIDDLIDKTVKIGSKTIKIKE